MQVTFFGDVDESYITGVLHQFQRLVPVPKTLHLFIVKNHHDCRTLSAHVPKTVFASFQQICSMERVSFSFFSANRQWIVLLITKQNEYVLHDPKALQGLLLHEFFHLDQMRKGVYKSIQRSYRKLLRLYSKPLINLHHKTFLPILGTIGTNAVFLLKDLYANSLLLERGYGAYLLRYYEQEFSLKKICPRPVFYERLQQAVHKDPSVLETVLTFEFALLSMILPFKKYQEPHAKQLLRHLARCYNLNTQDLLRKCKPFMDFYLDHYHTPSKAFQEHYLHLIFTKALALLT